MSDTALLSVSDGVTLADATINEALALRGHGEVVLPPGRFLLGGQLVLAPGVRLRGAGVGATTLLLSNPDADGVRGPDSAAGWALSDLTIEGQRGAAREGRRSGIVAQRSQDAVIERVRVQNTAGIAIALAGCSRPTIRDFTIANSGSMGLWLGFHTDSLSANFVRGAVIERGLIEATYLDALMLHREATVRSVSIVQGGLGYEPGAAGFWIAPDRTGLGGFGNTLVDCRARACQSSGFDLGRAANHNTLVACRAEYNARCGIAVAGSDNVVVGCQTTGNGSRGDTPLRDGLILGSEAGQPACTGNVVEGLVSDTNYGYGVALHSAATFGAYGAAPARNRISGAASANGAGAVNWSQVGNSNRIDLV